MKIRYKSGYKYQLVDGFSIKADIHTGETISTKHITLNQNGILIIRAGYAWDGPSGPAFDTLNFMRASLVHDALYQLLRSGKLSTIWRLDADMLMREICLEDGMWRIRAWWCYRAVRRFAAAAASSDKKKEIHEAGN